MVLLKSFANERRSPPINFAGCQRMASSVHHRLSYLKLNGGFSLTIISDNIKSNDVFFVCFAFSVSVGDQNGAILDRISSKAKKPRPFHETDKSKRLYPTNCIPHKTIRICP